MTLRDTLLEACQILREGGTLDSRALDQWQHELEQRYVEFEEELQNAALPAGFGSLEQLLQQSFGEFQEALEALRIAFEEDSPELAAWIQEKTQDADETLRQVRQSLEEYSSMLSEESN